MSAKKILLIEDDKDVRACLLVLLETLGHEVTEAEHGLRAINILVETGMRPDGIILDLMMPIMDGRDFLIELRKRFPAYDDVPVIILSAREDFSEMLDGISGKIERVSKPFSVIDFIALTDRFFAGGSHAG